MTPTFKRRVTRSTFNKLIRRLTKRVSLRTLERHINLSDGYLSKIKCSRSEPSQLLVSTLIMLDRDLEKGLADLRKLWTSVQKEALAL